MPVHIADATADSAEGILDELQRGAKGVRGPAGLLPELRAMWAEGGWSSPADLQEEAVEGHPSVYYETELPASYQYRRATMDWRTITINLQDEHVQQAIGELDQQYQRDGDPQDRRFLEVAFMRWLSDSMTVLMEEAAYYALGTNTAFTSGWELALRATRNDQEQRSGPFAPGTEPAPAGADLAERAAGLGRHLLEYGWVLGTAELLAPIAVHLSNNGHHQSVLITCPSEEPGMTLYQLRRLSELSHLALDNCTFHTIEEIMELEGYADTLAGGQGVVTHADRHLSLAQALHRRGLGAHVLLSYPVLNASEYLYYNLFAPGYRTEQELQDGWMLQSVEEIVALVSAPQLEALAEQIAQRLIEQRSVPPVEASPELRRLIAASLVGNDRGDWVLIQRPADDGRLTYELHQPYTIELPPHSGISASIVRDMLLPPRPDTPWPPLGDADCRALALYLGGFIQPGLMPAPAGCDNSRNQTIDWLLEHGKPFEPSLVWLGLQGGACDCTILNVLRRHVKGEAEQVALGLIEGGEVKAPADLVLHRQIAVLLSGLGLGDAGLLIWPNDEGQVAYTLYSGRIEVTPHGGGTVALVREVVEQTDPSVMTLSAPALSDEECAGLAAYLGQIVRGSGDCANSYAWTGEWLETRGKPVAPVLAWLQLLGAGGSCDCSVWRVLRRRATGAASNE